MIVGRYLVVLLSALVVLGGSHALSSSSLSSAPPQGSAARPALKQKVAILSGSGYLGGLTFGFLQRASTLYGTGLGGVRCIGATSETALRLNRLLSKHFSLAVADESVIKLTDLLSVEAVCNRLQGWDALILGADCAIAKRPVTLGSYEVTANDKTWEMVWDTPKSPLLGSSLTPREEQLRIKKEILTNVLTAARQVGIKHVVAVDDDPNESLVPLLKASGLMYTCFQPCGELVEIPGYSYRKGVQGKLLIAQQGTDLSVAGQVSKEDLAALCVQALQSLDWSQSRCLQVAGNGPATTGDDNGYKNPKRPDQEWCVNSYKLEAALAGL